MQILFFSLVLLGATHAGAQLHVPVQQHRRPARSSTITPPDGHHLTLLQESEAQNLSITIIDNQNVFYSAQVTLGSFTPPRTFTVLLDTGSSDFWVMQRTVSTDRTTTVSPLTNTFYELDLSPSGTRQSTTSINVQYGSGRISGPTVRDNVGIGGLTVRGQGFIDATIVEDLQDITGRASAGSPGVMDGIWGMGFDGLAENGFPTLISSMKTQGLIDSVRYSFDVMSDEPRLTIGAPDEALRPRGHTTVDVVRSTQGFLFWTVRIQRFRNLENDNDYCANSPNCIGIVDTGTTNFALPTDIFVSLMADIQSQRSDCVLFEQNTQVVCTRLTLSGLPDVNFTVANSEFIFRPEDYTVEVPVLLQGGRQIQANLLRFMNLGQTNTFIIGGPWFRSIYTTFDASDPERPRMEFAAQGPPNESILLTIILSVVGGVIGLCVIVACSYHFCVRKKRARARALGETNGRRLLVEDSSAGHVSLGPHPSGSFSQQPPRPSSSSSRYPGGAGGVVAVAPQRAPAPAVTSGFAGPTIAATGVPTSSATASSSAINPQLKRQQFPTSMPAPREPALVGSSGMPAPREPPAAPSSGVPAVVVVEPASAAPTSGASSGTSADYQPPTIRAVDSAHNA